MAAIFRRSLYRCCKRHKEPAQNSLDCNPIVPESDAVAREVTLNDGSTLDDAFATDTAGALEIADHVSTMHAAGSLHHANDRASFVKKICPLVLITLVFVYGLLCPIFFFIFSLTAFPGPRTHCTLNATSSFIFGSKGQEGTMVPVPEAQKPEFHLVFFGGNGGDFSGSLKQAVNLLSPLVEAENSTLLFQVYSASYPSYSPNEGWPSKANTVADGVDLVDYALSQANSTTGRVIVGGTSMGCAVTLQVSMERQNHVAGIVLHSPYSSFSKVIQEYRPPWTYLPTPWLWIADRWDSMDAAKSLPEEIPLLVLSSGDDKVIPPSQHQAVFEASDANLKWFKMVAGTEHKDVFGVANKSIDVLTVWIQAVKARL